MQLEVSTEAAISRRCSSTSSHRRCYSFGATSPLFAADPPPFWPSFCVCFLANPCPSCLALCSGLYAACSSLCSAAFQPPFRHCLPPFSHLQFWKQIPPNEPYRVILGDVRDKLYNTRERARQLLANGTSDIPEETTFTNVEQVMTKSKAMGIHIINEVTEHIMTETLYGDSLRLQQVLADFLLICINFTPTGGQVVVAASLTKDQLGKSVHLANLEISITHDGVGVPKILLNQMFGQDGQESEEGISLLISRKLLKLMNGDVRYLREAGKSSFILTVELAASQKLIA
ncbi:hypothetical protein HN51_012401 [Arachis hypogaea]